MDNQARANFLHDLNIEQKRIALRNLPYVLAYLALTAAPYIYFDIFLWDQDSLYFLAAFLGWAMGYVLLLFIMQRSGYFADGKESGVGVYFALGLSTGILIALALVVLILPGLYLLMRWLPVYARALTTEEWITQSMRWSWTATEPFQKPLAAALAGPVLFYGISLTAIYFYDAMGLSYEASVIIVHCAESVASAWLLILGVAAFGLLSETGHRRQELPDGAKPA